MEKFAGDVKVDNSWVIRLENRIVQKTIRFVPRWLETYHLTMMTIVWSLGVIFFGFLAVSDIRWLWTSSLMIFLQYVTDLYDGKLGKHRKTGLIKWGYYMDHFLDFVFLSCIFAGYYFFLPAEASIYLCGLMAVCAGFMVNSFLSFAATNKFKIEFLSMGPTQARFGMIAANTLFIFAGVEAPAKFIPIAFFISVAVLAIVVFSTRK